MIISGQLVSDQQSCIERGVIDRVESKYAVILIKDQKKQKMVPVKKLPAGLKEGVWVDITYAPEMTISINEYMTKKYATQNKQLRQTNKDNSIFFKRVESKE